MKPETIKPAPPDVILIRAIEPGDMEALTDVMNQPQVVRGTLQTPYVSVDARQKRHLALGPHDRMLAAFMDGRMIGMAGLHGLDNRRRAHCASIGLAVHDAYTGQGAGRALLTAMLELADRWLNYTRVELTVWADNARAIALYEKAGFEREGIFRNYAFRDGAYTDAVTMARLRP
jgi:putative acetyltransferase